MEKDPDLNYADALAKAWESNPELLASYDEEAGFKEGGNTHGKEFQWNTDQ